MEVATTSPLLPFSAPFLCRVLSASALCLRLPLFLFVGGLFLIIGGFAQSLLLLLLPSYWAFLLSLLAFLPEEVNVFFLSPMLPNQHLPVCPLSSSCRLTCACDIRQRCALVLVRLSLHA